MRNVTLAIGVLLLLSGCAGRQKSKLDPLVQISGDKAIAKTTQCTVPNSDGVRCNVKTCKQDQESDCSEFAANCIASGHQYSGTREGGTCTRVL